MQRKFLAFNKWYLLYMKYNLYVYLLAAIWWTRLDEVLLCFSYFLIPLTAFIISFKFVSKTIPPMIISSTILCAYKNLKIQIIKAYTLSWKSPYTFLKSYPQMAYELVNSRDPSNVWIKTWTLLQFGNFCDFH